MTMRHTCLFTGTITTREPLAWSPPGHVGPDKRALLPRMTVPTAAGPMESAFLGASTIRGRYRHACADRCLERERPVSLSRFLELKVGGVKGSAEDRRVDVRERIAFLEGEPVLSLFGAGASPIGWVHGRLDVGTALPSEPIEPVLLNGRRGNATEDPILLDVLDRDEVTRVRGGLDANRRRSRAVAEIRALRQRIARATRAGEDASELLLELEAARESEDGAARAQCELVGSDVSLLLPLPGYEALPTGTVLSHRMFLRHVSDAELALFMAGLARFAEDPRFGAHRAHGCGRVAVEYAVKRVDGARAQNIGAVSIDPERWDLDESSLALEGEPARWLAAWHDPAP